MAALVVQSRFAGLKIEDDDYPPSHDAQKGKKPKPNANKKQDTSKKNKTTNIKTQQNNNQPKKKKTKASVPSSVQWEVWRQKDEELVNGHYESELQQAMLLSKLDYEEKKDVYNRLKKDAEIERKAVENSARAATKKQKKKNIMSLEQFNDMVSGEESRNHPEEDKEPHSERKPPPPDTEFFNRVDDEARNEYLKDKINERVKHRQPVSDEVMTRIQFTDTIEQKDKEIAVLRQQIVTLKDELFTVKSRNKKLCNILGQGEMRDKAEVLVEVERLRGVQAELTAEVAELHSQLERERSKNTDSRTKDKKKKGGSSSEK